MITIDFGVGVGIGSARSTFYVSLIRKDDDSWMVDECTVPNGYKDAFSKQGDIVAYANLGNFLEGMAEKAIREHVIWVEPGQRQPKPAMVGVSVIVQKGDKFLVGKRGQACSRGAGLYAFPGGVINDDENWYACGVREVREETGMDIRFPQQALLSRTGVSCMPVSVSCVPGRVVFWLIGLWLRGEPVVMEADKCEGWNWLTAEEIEALPGVCNPSSPQYEWLPWDRIGPMLYDATH